MLCFATTTSKPFVAATKNVSANLLDESRANRDQALSQLADARAQLERARGNLARTEVRAPFAGHVVRRLASVGEYISVGDDVVRLVDTYRKEIALPGGQVGGADLEQRGLLDDQGYAGWQQAWAAYVQSGGQ